MKNAQALNSSNSYTADELPEEVFRDYDIRGFADSQINPKFAYKLGTALAIMLKQQHSVYTWVEMAGLAHPN